MWELARLCDGSRPRLHQRAAHRHLDWAREYTLAGDLDLAVEALRDLQALHAELQDPAGGDDEQDGDA